MPTIEQRITALEQHAEQSDTNHFVMICEGSEPTPEDRAKATQAEAEHSGVIIVTFH